jgi:ABC-2 type transport system ATP-binding protein
LEGLTKRYQTRAAVDGLDLEVEQGALYGFLGPNGAGKTTTIRMVLRLVRPDTGRITVLGEDLLSAAAAGRALRRTGALIEEPAFYPFLSGRKNLECLARAAGPAPDRLSRLKRIDEVLSLAGLSEAAGKRVRAYSQGMRQRLGIAAALLGAPDLLVLDEPTNGLDPQGMREVRMLLRRLADGGTTVFLSSHLLGEAEALCDRIGVLAQGRLVREGSPADLRAFAGAVTVEVDDLARAKTALARVDGAQIRPLDRESGAGSMTVDLSDGLKPRDINEALMRNGVSVDSLVPEKATLEEVFLSLVKGSDVPR